MMLAGLMVPSIFLGTMYICIYYNSYKLFSTRRTYKNTGGTEDEITIISRYTWQCYETETCMKPVASFVGLDLIELGFWKILEHSQKSCMHLQWNLQQTYMSESVMSSKTENYIAYLCIYVYIHIYSLKNSSQQLD